MQTIPKLTELLGRLPGIGPRQAKRFVYFLLMSQNGFREELARLLLELKHIVTVCPECFRFFTPNGTEKQCAICADHNRDRQTLMVVEKDVDFETIERSQAYRGTYFILGGTVPILEKNPAVRIRSKELAALVERRGEEKALKEIVLALSLTTEGENTTEYLAKLLQPLAEKHHIKISQLGRGLSTGSELEYSDPETIKNALKNRQ